MGIENIALLIKTLNIVTGYFFFHAELALLLSVSSQSSISKICSDSDSSSSPVLSLSGTSCNIKHLWSRYHWGWTEGEVHSQKILILEDTIRQRPLQYLVSCKLCLVFLRLPFGSSMIPQCPWLGCLPWSSSSSASFTLLLNADTAKSWRKSTKRRKRRERRSQKVQRVGDKTWYETFILIISYLRLRLKLLRKKVRLFGLLKDIK